MYQRHQQLGFALSHAVALLCWRLNPQLHPRLMEQICLQDAVHMPHDLP